MGLDVFVGVVFVVEFVVELAHFLLFGFDLGVKGCEGVGAVEETLDGVLVDEDLFIVFAGFVHPVEEDKKRR